MQACPTNSKEGIKAVCQNKKAEKKALFFFLNLLLYGNLLLGKYVKVLSKVLLQGKQASSYQKKKKILEERNTKRCGRSYKTQLKPVAMTNFSPGPSSPVTTYVHTYIYTSI